MKSKRKMRPRRKLLMHLILPLALASLLALSLFFIEFHSKIYSDQYLLIRVKDGTVVASSNETEQAYPASLTKIMTALLAIEYTEDSSTVVTVPTEIFAPIYKTGASIAGFEPSELATLEELLYGIMLPSGAECCLTYASHIAGSEDAFVALMNQRARELGMNDTNFRFCKSTSNIFESSVSSDTSGPPFPVSHLDTVLSLTCSCSESCACVICRSLRNLRMS